MSFGSGSPGACADALGTTSAPTSPHNPTNPTIARIRIRTF